ncbi:PREDICTED: interleukin-6 [Chinchilla lanigera]|uniref:interleukin-6 n=1 Tax=Chinchilla lanigera TaxID=34839 RepID=UPI00038EE4F2|nr:PREDICTED: interleukin-6 [Chinchilla lanigera]
MKFLSTSTFLPLAFLGLLLVTATAFPTSQVPQDFTADRITMPSKLTTSASQVFGMFIQVHKDVKALKSEISKHKVETAVLNNLDLPKLRTEDGCFYRGYNWETCQLKIITGLLKFQTYLQYVQNKLKSDSEDRKPERIYTGVKSLSLLMKAKVNSTEEIVSPSPTANASLLKKLESQNETQMLLSIEIILQSLEEFLQESMRAIRKAEPLDKEI